VAEEMDALDPDGVDHPFQLLDEAVVAPQAWVIGAIGVADAELVIEDDRPLIGQEGE
jgi:hypothetical protein